MIIDRVYTPGLAQVAYLIGDEQSGEAAIIDPRRDIATYLDWAAEKGLTFVAICETHVHADFVSGAKEMADETGATVYAGRIGATEFPHTPLDDGDEIRVGSLILRALWTPGHTPEHIAYLLIDPAKGSLPIAMFSGDVLFSEEIGRPDLLGAEAQQALIEQLYDTVTTRFSWLPDDLVVYPGHTAGSPCGKKIGDAPQTTMRQERNSNYAFNQPSREAFLRTVMDSMPKPPAYYPFMKRINKIGPADMDTLTHAAPMSPEAVVARHDAGALLIDARPGTAFRAGHIPGAVSVEHGASFAIWAGWLTPYDREVVLIVDTADQLADAITDLRRIGVDKITGWLDGGMTAWTAAGRAVATLTSMSVHDLFAHRNDPTSDLLVLDVRDESEFLEGSVKDATHFFVGRLAQGERPDLAGRRVAVICGSGYRSMVAASLLENMGAKEIINVEGGMNAWHAAGLPAVVRQEAAM